MKNKFYLLLLMCLLGLNATPIKAQCIIGTPGEICEDAQPACFPIDGTLPAIPAMGAVFPGCPAQSIDNPLWYAITITGSGQLTVSITPSNCQGVFGVPGFQAVLYQSCDLNSPSIYSAQCECTLGGIVFSAIVEPGIIYLLLDGCAGDVCDFTVEAFGPTIAPVDLEAPESISSDQLTYCPGDTATFIVTPIPGAAGYQWNFPAGTQLIELGCDTAKAMIGYESGPVTAQATDLCAVGPESPAITITVANAPEPDTLFLSYCIRTESGAIYPDNGLSYAAGNWIVQHAGSNPSGCDSTTLLIVEGLTSPVTEINASTCRAEPIEIAGVVFDSTLIDYELVLTAAAANGCDSILLVSIEQIEAFHSIVIFGTSDTLDCLDNEAIKFKFNEYWHGNEIITWSTTDGYIPIPQNDSIKILTVDSAGTYVVTLNAMGIDSSICEFKDSVTIFDGRELPEISTSLISESCGGLGDGEATVGIPSGNYPPYSTVWSNGATTTTISELLPGIYFVTVVGSNGCAIVDSVEITPSVQFEVSSTLVDCDSTNGTATVSIISGSNNPTYAWSNGGTGPVQNNLPAGWYSVTVMDAVTGCQSHQNVEVLFDPACYVLVSGHVYLDEPSLDCQLDSQSIGLPNILVELDNGDFTFTDNDGYYNFEVLPDDYEINAVLNTPQYEALCADPINISAGPFGATLDSNDFYLEYGGIRDLAIKVNKGNARPGFLQTVRICVMNNGNLPLSGQLTFVHDSLQNYVNTINYPPDSYDTISHTLTWSFSDHPPGFVRVYKVQFQIDPTTPIGTELNMYFRVDSDSNDDDLSNNELLCTQTVTGSYDPNDKQVSPVGIGEDGDILESDTLLSYLIRFQNTGTDTAFTVVIRDTLDPNLDIRTLVPGPSSHPYHLTVLDDRVLEFTFENIMLPDSNINEVESHGFVFFDIGLKMDLGLGTMIHNTADIYFDFNLPVRTNTVTNTLTRLTGNSRSPKAAIYLAVWPNPSDGAAVLEYELKEAQDLQIDLYNMRGQRIKQILASEWQGAGRYQLKFAEANIPKGVYLIHLRAGNGQQQSIRWVKME